MEKKVLPKILRKTMQKLQDERNGICPLFSIIFVRKCT